MLPRARVPAVMLLGLVVAGGCDLDPVPVGQDLGSSDDGATVTGTAGPATAVGSTGLPGGSQDGSEDGETSSAGNSSSDSTDTSDGAEGTTDGSPSSCSPLVQDCSAPDGCYPDGDAFDCRGPTQDEPEGSPCAAHEECAPGLYCGPDDRCRPFCDVDDPEPCDYAWQLCDRWYPEGTAPEGLDRLGSCVEPMADPPQCDPGLQDCPLGDACYPSQLGATFACATNTGTADPGEPCMDDGECGSGSWCDADACVQFCIVDVPGNCIEPGTMCVPWYPLGGAPMGLDMLGSCVGP